MNGYLLDTNIIIDFLRNKREIIEVVNGLLGKIYTSIICVAELYEGVYRVENSQKYEERILTHLNTYNQIYSLDFDICRHFGEIRASLKKKGEKIEDLDIFIAATCVANDLILVTKNPKHFSRIPALQIKGV